MKTAILTIISIFLMGACGHLANRSQVQLSQVQQEQLDSRVVQQIKEYYHLTYGEGMRLEESAEAAAIQLKYYNIPENDDEK